MRVRAMPGEDEKFEIPGDEMESYVPLVRVPSQEEAERLRDLLEDHDIPSSIGSDEDVKSDDDSAVPLDSGSVRGVQILVPIALIDEAQEIVADIDDTDEFDINEETVDSEDDADDKYGFEEVVVPDDEDSLSGADRLMAELEPDDKDYEDDTDEHS